MAGEPVPADDLPGSEVPAGDMPAPAREPTIWEKVARGFLQGGAVGAGTEIARNTLGGLEKAGQYAGGVATDLTAKVAPPEVAGAVGTAVSMAPGMVGGGGLGTAMRQAPRAGAEWLMQSALKPSVKALKNQGATGTNAERGIATLLDEGATVGRGSIEKMQGKVDDLAAKIADTLNTSGATVDKNAVAARLQDVINKIERTDLHPQQRVKLVQDIYDEVLTSTNTGRQIPVARANEIKQGIYQKLKDKYGELGSDAVESEKALARGLKEEISAAHPEVAQLNKRESDLINALELVRHRAFVTGNKDLGGLAWLTANPAQFAAFMADRSPLFKSIVAQMLNQTSKKAPAVGAAAGSATGGIEQK